MKIPVFGIYDRKSQWYKTVFHARSKAEAIRSFASAINSSGRTEMNDYPEDFELVEIAEFDDQTGKYKNKESFDRLGTGQDYIKPDKQQFLPAMPAVPDKSTDDRRGIDGKIKR